MVRPKERPRKQRVLKSSEETASPSGERIAATIFLTSVLSDGLPRRRVADKTPSVGTDTNCASDPIPLLSVETRGDLRLTTLFFTGVLETNTVSQLRDVAFTAIGARPRLLCLDLTHVSLPDAAALDALVTIRSVARIMQVDFYVHASSHLSELLESTHLSRLLPIGCSDSLDFAFGPSERADGFGRGETHG